MTKNIVVCCDGTWNTPEHMDHGLPSPTNVVKLYNALIKDQQQEVYYHPGVGTGRNWWDKIAGGGTGEGLDQNIKSAYRWLGTHYAAGDRIFLFGFSRGAYTVRSLGGLIAKCGLLDLSTQMTPAEVWKRTDEIFAAYRKGVEFANPNGYAFHNRRPEKPPKKRRQSISSASGTPLVRLAFPTIWRCLVYSTVLRITDFTTRP